MRVGRIEILGAVYDICLERAEDKTPAKKTDCVYDAGEYCAIKSSTGKLVSCTGKCKDFYAKEKKE